MCGRYSLEARPDEIAEAFEIAEAVACAARYNIAPTQTVPVIRVDPATTHRCLEMIRWGLPSYGTNTRPLINARSETVDRKPTFRSAFASRRCLVPATGFFEWQKLGRAKQPFHFRPRDGRREALMYFFLNQGKQCVDFRGDLILTHNADLMTGRTKSAAPRQAKNARYIPNIAAMTRRQKIAATWRAVQFIWGPDVSLDKEVADRELAP